MRIQKKRKKLEIYTRKRMFSTGPLFRAIIYNSFSGLYLTVVYVLLHICFIEKDHELITLWL
jgi:hypothetical protein